MKNGMRKNRPAIFALFVRHYDDSRPSVTYWSTDREETVRHLNQTIEVLKGYSGRFGWMDDHWCVFEKDGTIRSRFWIKAMTESEVVAHNKELRNAGNLPDAWKLERAAYETKTMKQGMSS
jgi:hypothetical protein